MVGPILVRKYFIETCDCLAVWKCGKTVPKKTLAMELKIKGGTTLPFCIRAIADGRERPRPLPPNLLITIMQNLETHKGETQQEGTQSNPMQNKPHQASQSEVVYFYELTRNCCVNAFIVAERKICLSRLLF